MISDTPQRIVTFANEWRTKEQLHFSTIRDGRSFRVVSAINNNAYHRFIIDGAITLNQTYYLEIHQRYVSNGNYRYYIVIDGQEKHSVINKSAKQLYNVEISVCMNECPGVAFVKNMKLTNFL